jgi:hypothetical protein
MSQYSIGSVIVEYGSQIVLGQGTSFLTNVTPGDLFKKTGQQNTLYEVASVDSDEQITLSSNYAGSGESGVSYSITRDFTPNLSLPEINIGDRDWPYILTRALRIIDSAIVGVVPGSGYVTKADFNAHTVLSADTDNIPVALTVAASTVVGRKSTGGIVALTMSDLRAELGNLDGRQQQITSALSVTINWALGATAYMVFANSTVALTFLNGVAGRVYRLLVTQSSSPPNVFTFATDVKWRGGTAPTLSTSGGAIDIYTFVYINNEWYGDCALNFG